MDSGIEMVMIRVLRQLPRNSSTIRAVSAAAISASVTTPLTAARTNTDWSPVAAMEAPVRQQLADPRQPRLDRH